MPEDKQNEDIYISHQLALTFMGPKNDPDSGLPNNVSELNTKDFQPIRNSNDDQSVENDTVSGTVTESIYIEKTSGLMPSVVESDGGFINSVIEKESPPSIIRSVADRYLFVDLETGGLYPDKHAVLQVAAVITDFDFNIKGQFMSYIQPHPGLEITKEALAINQLNLDHLQTAPTEKAVATAMAQFVRLVGIEPRFVGYNCQFDLEFLAYLWERHDLLPAPYQVPWLDIYAVAKSRLGTEAGLPNFKLVSVATHFGVTTDGAHDALADLIMTIEVAKYLQALPEKQTSAKNGNDLETAKFSL